MVGAVSGVNAYYNVYGAYGSRPGAAQGVQDPESARSAQGTALWAARRSASPETPVQPVAPVRPVEGDKTQPVRLGPAVREGADPAEMAVRMRIKPYEESAPGQVQEKSQDANGEDLKVGAEGAQAAVEDGKCQTCEKRKYQDESDDMGVSFQTPTNIAPEQAASAVRGHENEHVVREKAKARQEGRRVVSQSVTLHTDICPECGKVYISGGTTRTVTAAANTIEQPDPAQEAEQQAEQKGFSVFG